MRREKVLFVVHEKTAERWERGESIQSITQRDRINARRLLKKLRTAKPKYHRTIQFEDDPWVTDSHDTSGVSWGKIASGLRDCLVDVAGMRRSVCVRRVVDELNSHGVRARFNFRLTID